MAQDWQWDGKAEIHQRQRVREPATFHLSVGDRSSINYTLPMVVGASGYQPILDIHLDTAVVTSSLNDIRLVSAESCRVGLMLHLILTLFNKFKRSAVSYQPHCNGTSSANGLLLHLYGSPFSTLYATTSICSSILEETGRQGRRPIINVSFLWSTMSSLKCIIMSSICMLMTIILLTNRSLEMKTVSCSHL